MSEASKEKMRLAQQNHPQGTGEKAINWKGGKVIDKRGYILIYCPTHPNAVGNYVPEHRLVMEKKIGRFLLRKEHVHHINHNNQDNRPENLMILSRGEHSRIHRNHETANGIPGANSQQRKEWIKNHRS
ncbi:MAG: HNH endonuclease [Methanoregula sp.]